MAPRGTILVVDDDHAVREAIELLLTPRYTVQTAGSGSAAMDAICSNFFDLILLDYCLPDLPGTDLLRIVKRFFPSTMVVLITGLGSEDVAIEALRGGARDYIRKPIHPRDLQDRIARLFDLPRAGKERRQNPYVHRADSLLPGGPATEDPEATDHARAILKAMRYIDDNFGGGLSLGAVARAAGMSKFHFCRRFVACTGLNFREYLTRRRIARAKELLRDDGRTISDVARDVGFKDTTHFGRVFKRLERQLPSAFRRRADATGERPVGTAAPTSLRPSNLGDSSSGGPS